MSDAFRVLLPAAPLHYTARAYHTEVDGSFNADQYADMIATRLFEDCSHLPAIDQAKIYEDEAAVKRLVKSHLLQAMGDARRPVGHKYEHGQASSARGLLPGSFLSAAARLPRSELVVAGRHFVAKADKTFSPARYAQDCFDGLVDYAPRLSRFSRSQLLDDTAYVKRVLLKYFAEAIADARRQVGARFENGNVDGARVGLLSSSLAAL